MAIAEELQILVNAKVSQAVRDMKKVDKTIDTTSKTAKKLKDAFKALAGSVAIGAVITGLVKLGKEAEKAFQIQEKAVIGVNAALKATGQFTEEASQDIQDYASELQELTVVGDETSLSMIQTAINMGLTTEEAKEATKQAIGMSEAFGVGLNTSLRAVANSTLGNYDALTRYLPAIKTTKDQAEKAAIVQEQLGNAFTVATANAQTSEGVQKQLKNSYGDLQETIGGLISEGMTPYRENLKKEVESVNRSITAHILRKKALEGNATLVEKLTLAQIREEEAEEKLAQAKQNIATAEKNVIDNTYLSEIQVARIALAREAALKKAKENIEVLKGELAATQRITGAAQRRVQEEYNRIQANILLAQGIIKITDETENNTAALDKNKKAAEEAEQAWLDSYNEKAALEFKIAEALVEREKRRKEFAQKEIDDAKEITDAWVNAYSNITNAAVTLFSSIGSLVTASANREIMELDRVMQARIEAAGLAEATEKERLENELDAAVAAGDAKTAEEKRNEIARLAILTEFEKKKAKVEYEAALATWKLQLAGAVASGAAGVARTIASVPFPWNIPLGILQGTAAGVQIAAVAAAKPIPAFAQGGSFMTQGEQMFMAGDNPGGIEKITVEPVSSTGANVDRASGGETMILNIDGESFLGWMQSKLDNRQLRVPRGVLV